MSAVSSAAHALAGPLAYPLSGDPLAKGGEAVKAGPVGLVVIVLLCVASYFLFRSMSKHLRTVREKFPSDAPPGPTTRAPAPVSDATAKPGTPAAPGAPDSRRETPPSA